MAWGDIAIVTRFLAPATGRQTVSPRDLAAWAATTHGATQASAAVLVAAAIVCGVAYLWFRADDRVSSRPTSGAGGAGGWAP